MILDIALGLAGVAPSIVRWITGSDKAEQVAEGVVGLAKTVAGVDDADAAIKAIRDNPELAVRFQEAWLRYELGLFESETRRLQAVNETMRAEAASGSLYQSSWRPLWGYVSCVVWAIWVLGVVGLAGWAVLANPIEAVAIITALGALSSQLSLIFGAALAVLGVAVWQRSSDKKAILGLDADLLPDGLGKAASKLLGGSK